MISSAPSSNEVPYPDIGQRPKRGNTESTENEDYIGAKLVIIMLVTYVRTSSNSNTVMFNFSL